MEEQNIVAGDVEVNEAVDAGDVKVVNEAAADDKDTGDKAAD